MSDEIGERMRSAANAAAARSRRPPVTDVRRRLARRRAGMSAGVAAVVALAFAASAGAWDTTSGGLRPVAPSPSASVTPSPSPSPTASPAPPVPGTIVAARGDEGEERPLVFLSSATGRVVRSMYVDHGDTALGRPVVSSDRKTVYFSRYLASCLSQVVAVPARGGEETVVADGWDPAISPDGRWLAYQARADVCSDRDVLVVKDLRTGTERRWSSRPGNDGEVVTTAWAPDSLHLAVVRRLPRKPEDVQPANGSAGYVDDFLWIVDTRAPGTTLDAGRQVPGVKGVYSVVTYRGPEGALLLLRVPAHLDLPSALVEVDPETGRQQDLVTFPHAVYDVDFDASGQHLLYVWNDTLYRWVGGRSVKVADRVNGADW